MKVQQRPCHPENPGARRLVEINGGITAADAGQFATSEEVEDALAELARRTSAVNRPIDRT